MGRKHVSLLAFYCLGKNFIHIEKDKMAVQVVRRKETDDRKMQLVMLLKRRYQERVTQRVAERE